MPQKHCQALPVPREPGILNKEDTLDIPTTLYTADVLAVGHTPVPKASLPAVPLLFIQRKTHQLKKGEERDWAVAAAQTRVPQHPGPSLHLSHLKGGLGDPPMSCPEVLKK